VKLVNATAEIDNAYTYFNDETSEFFVNISGTDLIPSEGTNPENYIELIIDGIM
jgi:hypothetical protein